MRALILGGLLALFLYSTASAQNTIIHTYDGTLPATGNETVPQNASQVVIELYGGGGGGGVSAGNYSLARGGGGGGYCLIKIDIVESDWGKTLAYRRAVSADGGTGPFASGGQSGDYSYVGTQNLANGSSTTPVIANGGEAGTMDITGSGGAGGTASGGDTNLTGGDADSTGAGGNGAGPLGGTGGAVPTSSGAGDGNALGGGGAGGAQILGGSGGTGRLGRVIFTWTVTTPVPTPTPNLPKVTVRATRTQLREGAVSTITFSTNQFVQQDLFVHYSVSGRASNLDYSLTGTPGVVKIPTNQNSASIQLQSILDNVREPNGEPAVITIDASPDGSYEVSSNKNAKRAVVLILDRKS